MGENSHIEWTDHTFNPWIGCTKVSPGCANCYAEAMNVRWHKGRNWGKGAPRRRTSPGNWKEPLRWNRWSETIRGHQFDIQEKQARRPRVFCASLADWLDDEVPIEWLADLLKLIHDTPHLDWLLLTKRPENFRPRLIAAKNWVTKRVRGNNDRDIEWCFIIDWLQAGTGISGANAPDNVWIGTTVENQELADKRIPELLKIPARVRFLSCEPLLGEVVLDWGRILETRVPNIHWVICGGESGPKARPMHPDWACFLRDQCQVAGVPFFFKQWGEWAPCPPIRDARAVQIQAGMQRMGKTAAGRLLDGREWSEFPALCASATPEGGL